jgi:pimeloyl-ACP methyl ester carboxylesterase
VSTLAPLQTHRDRLLSGLPVTERRLDAAAVPTAVLEGGDGPPVVLLHGAAEAAANRRWTIPDVATTHRWSPPTCRPTARPGQSTARSTPNWPWPRTPTDELEQIRVPVTIIWGRHDRALPLRIAERASAQRGWPLHVIEDAADDPARDQPESFLRALRSALPDG